MSSAPLPLLLEPEMLEPLLGDPRLLLVDLSRAEIHAQYHIPGAVPLEYGLIVRMAPPVGGLLPDEAQLSEILSAIGLTPERHVVAYDDEGGGKACRLLWTLEAIGHTRYSLLNGGLHAWANEGHKLTQQPSPATPSSYDARYTNGEVVADAAYILAHLGDASHALVDARTPLEYRGLQRYSARGGHIPGAVNFEWTEAMDQGRNLRLKPAADLRRQLEALGITPDKTVVAYCQTHHRSAHTWFMLKWLGYRARGYAGSWSDWGNREDTPVEN
ncbi:sulfurtransferase [Sulfurivermis fontis]|uniref:sulfurtransferase n=1 Tax=Sulfurivermis fontis TaxID=1972068 RepID=UPI000FD70111|nr:sulfurtransferase [Sulfurivermis fontis]